MNTLFNCAGKLMSSCHSVNLLLKFSVPVLEELAAFDFSARGIHATSDNDAYRKSKEKPQM